MNTSKTAVHFAGAVALLFLMDAYTIREIRNLRAQIAVAERAIAPQAAQLRPTTQPVPPPVNRLASNTEIARVYSIGSAETRNLPGR